VSLNVRSVYVAGRREVIRDILEQKFGTKRHVWDRRWDNEIKPRGTGTGVVPN